MAVVRTEDSVVRKQDSALERNLVIAAHPRDWEVEGCQLRRCPRSERQIRAMGEDFVRICNPLFYCL